MKYSLRQLLLVSLLSASMLIWGIAAYLNYKVTRDEVANLFDAELAQSAKVLNAFVESLAREGSLSGNWSQEQEKTDEMLRAYALNRKFKSKNDDKLWSEYDGLLPRSENPPVFSVHDINQTTIDDQLWPIFDGLLKANALGHKYERKIAFQLWSQKKGLMLRSESAPKFAFSSSDHGFSETNIDGHEWHVFSITNGTGEYNRC